MSFKLKPDTGLNNDNTYDIKVFMRTYNDAIRCSNEIAQKDTAVDHYKNYIRLLVNGLKKKQIMIDSDNKVMGSYNLAVSETYSLMKFAQSKHR